MNEVLRSHVPKNVESVDLGRLVLDPHQTFGAPRVLAVDFVGLRD